MTEAPPTFGPRPALGASWNGGGVTFALRSRHASGAEVCLFADDGSAITSFAMAPQGDVWSVSVPGIGPGQRYGFRVDGPYAPDAGHRFNAAKLLVDPYARALCGNLTWDASTVGHASATEPDPLDSAGSVPHSLVIDPAFDWRGDRPPATPWASTVIYETHVRGMTRRHPGLPTALRGTYLGLAHPAVTEHLRALGVTAVELLPVQHFASERHLDASGLTNYWGYSPVGWFAPHAGYACGRAGEQVREFKEMVRALHRAGLEVLIDVVYNHTVEGDAGGPTLSLRGLDNACYYRAPPGARQTYEDLTGCGNTLDFSRPEVLDLVHDSLRYWVEEMHVDGFRFDLAPTLGRDPVDFDPAGGLLGRLADDPLFRGVKLIAEPWDLGPGGYALGRFPPGWAEWNDRYRDGVRRFWRGDSETDRELRQRLEGSLDLFAERGSCASINYVTAHDGFTLADLVSYERKHNHANGEENRDGSNHDHSANWGVEGPTASPSIRALRARLQRTFIATLALSRGVPMLGHGSELGRTQRGNNNAYCQDNETSWVDWDLDDDDASLLAFTRSAFRLRRSLQLGCGRGHPGRVTWLTAEGSPLQREPSSESDALAFMLHRVQDGCEHLVLFNGGSTSRSFALPPPGAGTSWRLLLHSAVPLADGSAATARALRVPPHSIACLSGVATPARPSADGASVPTPVMMRQQ